MTKLEHVNLTVSDPKRQAQVLCDLFNWEVRWAGPAASGGFTVHVGQPDNGDGYLALYEPPAKTLKNSGNDGTEGNLNHVAVVVDDLQATDEKARSLGLTTFNHGDYEPGERFYFQLTDEVEVEVVSYHS